MKSIKGIPFKVFLIVLVAGIIGITGMIIMKYDIDKLSDSYREIIDEHSVNRSYMSKISGLLYENQAVIANYVIAVDDIQRARYMQTNERLRDEITEQFNEFNKRIDTAEKEQYYHKLYSNYYSYLKNADIVFKLINDGSIATAQYYTNNVLTDFVEKVNTNLGELDKMSLGEMEQAKKQMEYYISIAKQSEIACILLLTCAVIFCIVFCVRLTMRLERYKDELEVDIESKNKVLQEHNRKLIEMQNNTIIGMANLIESRDGDTGEHVKNTSLYVGMLAKEAQKNRYCSNILTDEYIEMLIKAAPMHDIGKIIVPDAILQKPGKLTVEEFEQMKAHALEGGRIVQEVLGGIEEQEYVDIASEVASGHHEKWDGTGYPFGLKESDIPVSARIMAIADVFDALVSKRCYKEAMPADVAFSIIEKDAGTHFDPVLAKMFVRMKDEILKVQSSEN